MCAFLTANVTFLNGSVQQISRPGFTGAGIEESDNALAVPIPISRPVGRLGDPAFPDDPGSHAADPPASLPVGGDLQHGLMFGFSTDLLLEGREPIVRLAMNVVSSGAFCIFYLLFSLPVQIWRIAAVTAGHVVFIIVSSRAFPLLPDAPPGRLTLDAVGIFATMIVGQTMFLHFINGTAARYLRAHAEIAVARDIHRVLYRPSTAGSALTSFSDARTPAVTSAATWWTW